MIGSRSARSTLHLPSQGQRIEVLEPRFAQVIDNSTLGAEEEFHVVDLATRQLVARAPELLERLPAKGFTAELHRSVIETNTPVCPTLDDLRMHLVRLRQAAAAVAEQAGLGIIAAGTSPLADLDESVTPNMRNRQMLDDYQLLVREQYICGAQVHVGVPDKDEAVALVPRLAPWLPMLLALSASSPFWKGEDTGYASMRSLIWSRWPTAGMGDLPTSRAEYDQLVTDLVESGTITDPGMIYFDVRPSAHVPTVELRITDACPDVDTVVLLAGLFHAIVRREQTALAGGVPIIRHHPALLRAATWRAARSGLAGDLIDLTLPTRKPLPAAVVIPAMVQRLRPYLEMNCAWEQISELAERAMATGDSAQLQRAAFARRGRLTDVVDLLVAQTTGVHP